MAGIRRFYFQFMDTASSPECLSSTQILYKNYIFPNMKKKTSENHGRLLAGSVEKQIMTQTLIRYLKWNIETEVIAKLVMGLWSVGSKLQRPGRFV